MMMFKIYLKYNILWLYRWPSSTTTLPSTSRTIWSQDWSRQFLGSSFSLTFSCTLRSRCSYQTAFKKHERRISTEIMTAFLAASSLSIGVTFLFLHIGIYLWYLWLSIYSTKFLSFTFVKISKSRNNKINMKIKM